MSTVRVYSTIDRLERDLLGAGRKAAVELRHVIEEGIRVGNSVAQDNARATARRHGKLYPRAFSTEMHGAASSLAGGNFYSGEYGPDAAMPQGNMEFEWGSRNQPPHLDLNKSADLIGPAMPGEVRAVLGRVFW